MALAYFTECWEKHWGLQGAHTLINLYQLKEGVKAQLKKPLPWDISLGGDPRAQSSCASIFKLLQIFTGSTIRELKHWATGCACLHVLSGRYLAKDCQHLLPWHFSREHLQHTDLGISMGNGKALPEDAPAFADNCRHALHQHICARGLTSRGAEHPQPSAEKSHIYILYNS